MTRSCDLLTCDMKDSSVLVNSTSAESDLESLPPETFSLVVSKSLNVMDFVELVLSTLTTMLLTCIDKQLPWLDTNVSGCGHVLASSVVLLISNGIKLILSLADLTVLVSREYHIRKEGLEDKVIVGVTCAFNINFIESCMYEMHVQDVFNFFALLSLCFHLYRHPLPFITYQLPCLTVPLK